eukprot:gnl/Trimastix_PCT/399.p1 GENE.gnl/Trimastix_PCT/399~~gnl/Trimastix_PCT/399.p1  ORF type:complete len:405 (-),score=104.97 gnl/Trimastix_PCT/399:99-1139(-)
MTHIQAFAKSFVQKFNIAPLGAHMGIVNFASFATLEMCLTGTKCALDMTIDRVQQKMGTTSISTGIIKAREEFEQHGRRDSNSKRVLILLSDGVTSGALTEQQELERIRTELGTISTTIKTNLFAVGVGANVSQSFLEAITQPIAKNNRFEGRVLTVASYADLASKIQEIVKASCYYTFTGSCAHVAWLLSILVLIHCVHINLLLWRRPRLEGHRRIAKIMYIALSGIAGLLLLLSFIMAAITDPAVKSGVCGAIIAFAVIAILLSAATIFVIWFKNWESVQAPAINVPTRSGPSAAALSTLNSGGSTPAGMTGFRLDGDKVDPMVAQPVTGHEIKKPPPPMPPAV